MGSQDGTKTAHEHDTFRSNILGDFVEIKSRTYPFFHSLRQIEEKALNQIGQYSEIISSLKGGCQDALILGEIEIWVTNVMKLIIRSYQCCQTT